MMTCSSLKTRICATGLLLLALGCNRSDGGESRDAASATETGIDSVGTQTGTGGPTSADSDSMSQSTSGSATITDGMTSSADEDTTDSGVKFDLAAMPDAGGSGCDDGMGSYDFSYIWVANSTEGTASKINTVTGVEEGRYWTHPSMGGGSPSRTSVNLQGDVAVSNRDPGSVVRIAAGANCQDFNSNGVIDTSTGPQDVLPWGEDECVLWYTEIPSPSYSSGPRPTAWEGGEVDEASCTLVSTPRLWIGFKDGAGHGMFYRMDGDTGAVLDMVDAGVWGTSGDYGPYGGAVNAEGDLVATGLNQNPSVHIDSETLQVTDLGNPGGCKYGMGLDQDGNLWVGGCFGEGVYNYDFTTQSWTTIDVGGGTRVNGVQVDRDGNVWGAGGSPCRVVQLDVATKQVINNNIQVPGCGSDPRGISIDRDGYVWLVDMTSNQAFKIHPETYQTEITVAGLVYPYTYSDMTGSGLNLVVNPPG